MPIDAEDNKIMGSSQTLSNNPANQANPAALDTQIPDISGMGKDKITLKQVFAFIVLILIIIPVLVVNFNFFQQIKKSQSVVVEDTNTSPPSETRRLSAGEETINIKPGGIFILADGVSNVHFNGGSENAVPNIIFNKNYSLNDIHEINYVDIRKEISFYNEGYFYKLTNVGCNKARKFDIDVVITVVTDCNLRIDTKKESAPLKQMSSFSKILHTTQSFTGQVSSPNEILIYVMMPKLSLQNYSTQFSSENVNLQAGSMTSYSPSSFWDVTFVTGYGIETIRYTAEELWNKESKEVSVGPLQIKSKIQDFSCSIIYRGSNGEVTQRCDDIPVELSFDQIGQQIPIKILTYSN